MSEKLFLEVKSLAGANFILASQVIAVQMMEAAKCQVMMAGGITIPCAEAAKDIVARLETTLKKS